MTDKKNFEDAYARLEQILERMNSNTVSLDESIKLYEEADKLIQHCQGKLTEAEQKVEILLKNRDGSLQMNEKEQPARQEFNPQKSFV
ncbi:MAG: exodeoxyribonuclease VII small subunit [Chlamydiales bacterium]